jgi:hypothetical protein
MKKFVDPDVISRVASQILSSDTNTKDLKKN